MECLRSFLAPSLSRNRDLKTRRQPSRLQLRLQRNLRIQQTGNRAARFGSVCNGGEFFPDQCREFFAVISRCDSVTVGPWAHSKVTVAVVAMESGLKPALPSSDENAIEKAARMRPPRTILGLVPTAVLEACA